MLNEGNQYIISYLVPVPTFLKVPVPVPLVKKLRFLRVLRRLFFTALQ
jgi:hypothetical protein